MCFSAQRNFLKLLTGSTEVLFFSSSVRGSVQSRHRKTSKLTVNWGWGRRAESKMTEIWINRYATRRGEIAHMPLKWERPPRVNVWVFSCFKVFLSFFLVFLFFFFFVQENLMPGHMTLKPKSSVFKFLIRWIAFAKENTHKFCGEACRTLFCLQRSLTFYRAGLRTCLTFGYWMMKNLQSFKEVLLQLQYSK